MKDEQGTELRGVNGSNGTETAAEPKPDPVPTSFTARLKSIVTFLTVEPYLLCYILPVAISSLAVQKFNTEKACLVDLNYTQDICTKAINGDIDENDNITKTAQFEASKMITDMQSWQAPLASSVPALVILFVGAWSDRTGNRKALMLIPIIGELVSSLGLLLATYFFMEIPLWSTALIEAVPTALSGGQSIALMGSYSYVADVTSVEARTFRIGVVAVIVSLGFPFGTSISGVLTQNVGYYGVFTIGFLLYVIGFIYTSLRIHDVNPIETDGTFKDKIKEFFHPKNVWDTVSIVYHARGKQRAKIILVIMAHVVILGPVIGEAYVFFQYVLTKFNMDIVDISFFSTYSILMGTIGTGVAVTLFSKFLKLHDAFIGMIATTCKTLASFVYGVAPTTGWYYTGPVVDFFGNSGVTAIRSLGTKVVDVDDVAKMCSIIGFAESILPMVYGPIYTQIYSNTLTVFPGLVYIIGGVMTIPAFIIFLVIYLMHKKESRDVVKDPGAKEMHAHENVATVL